MVSKNLSKNVNTLNRYLVKKLKGKPLPLSNAASYLIMSGGKGLRPVLVV